MKTIKIWSNARLEWDAIDELKRAMIEHEFVLSTPEAPAPLEDAVVAFGQPDLAQLAASNSALKWIQLTSAGYTRYDTHDVRALLNARNVALTTSSDVYADPCAQHVLAMMMAGARQLPQSLESQHAKRWDHDLHRKTVRAIGDGQLVAVVGYGSIGARLAELLAPFDIEFLGFRRTRREDDAANIFTIDALDEHLPRADHVVNLLPLSDSSRHLFTAERFARMKSSAIFYNVGRGDTVDQNALRVALESDRLAAAYLDVTSPEPLPPDDPLWTTPRCFITPHIAGGLENESHALVGHFLSNLERFAGGKALRNRVI